MKLLTEQLNDSLTSLDDHQIKAGEIFEHRDNFV